MSCIAKVFKEYYYSNWLLCEEELWLCQSQRLPKMANSGSPQTEIILDIWNILTTVSGDTVTNVDSLQIKSAH
jgi:hypothetical protein